MKMQKMGIIARFSFVFLDKNSVQGSLRFFSLLKNKCLNSRVYREFIIFAIECHLCVRSCLRHLLDESEIHK